MRRRVGVGGIQKKRLEEKKFADKGDELAENQVSPGSTCTSTVTSCTAPQLTELSGQLATFQTNLETFAREHKAEIRKDPEFRRHFQVSNPERTAMLIVLMMLTMLMVTMVVQEMCASIGVDPLASGKGFWSNMLDIGDFYYELGVQIVEVPGVPLVLTLHCLPGLPDEAIPQVCMASAHKTGGLMELGELRQRLIRAR